MKYMSGLAGGFVIGVVFLFIATIALVLTGTRDPMQNVVVYGGVFLFLSAVIWMLLGSSLARLK